MAADCWQASSGAFAWLVAATRAGITTADEPRMAFLPSLKEAICCRNKCNSSLSSQINGRSKAFTVIFTSQEYSLRQDFNDTLSESLHNKSIDNIEWYIPEYIMAKLLYFLVVTCTF